MRREAIQRLDYEFKHVDGENRAKAFEVARDKYCGKQRANHEVAHVAWECFPPEVEKQECDRCPKHCSGKYHDYGFPKRHAKQHGKEISRERHSEFKAVEARKHIRQIRGHRHRKRDYRKEIENPEIEAAKIWNHDVSCARHFERHKRERAYYRRQRLHQLRHVQKIVDYADEAHEHERKRHRHYRHVVTDSDYGKRIKRKHERNRDDKRKQHRKPAHLRHIRLPGLVHVLASHPRSLKAGQHPH